jgi:hypothetical protein
MVALIDEVTTTVARRAAQQRNRAGTVRGSEYVGRLRERGLTGLADALDKNVAEAIQVNADLLEEEVRAIVAKYRP